ncbi:YlbF family regulator, partial [Staphylococcus argensis]|nr:YlbF family regulator [Staphylococcus argensis]
YAVSDHVKIEAGNPFFQKHKGGCATGASCKCSL